MKEVARADNDIRTLESHIKDIASISRALEVLSEKQTALEKKFCDPSELNSLNLIKQDIKCFKQLIIMKASLIVRQDIVKYSEKF